MIKYKKKYESYGIVFDQQKEIGIKFIFKIKSYSLRMYFIIFFIT